MQWLVLSLCVRRFSFRIGAESFSYHIRHVVLPMHQLLELTCSLRACIIKWYTLIAWVDIISPNCPQKRSHNSLLAAHPLLNIFSVVGDPFGIRCLVNWSKVVLSAPPLPNAHASAPPLSICARAYHPSFHVNFCTLPRLLVSFVSVCCV